jgi:hypothetical protein
VPTDLAGDIVAQIREAEAAVGITLPSAEDPAEDDEDEDD